MDLNLSRIGKAASGSDTARSKKRLRFIISSPTASACSTATNVTMTTRVSSASLFRLPRQLTEERSGPERARELDEKLLYLWANGLSGPPENLEQLMSTIEQKFQAHRPKNDDELESIATELNDYDAASHNPIFYGKMYKSVDVDADVMENFDPSVTHPSCVGYAFVDKPPKSPPPPPTPLPPKDTCAPRVYLEKYIFPTLLPALEEMLRAARTEKCFERKRTKFNAMDFLTEHLYSHNPNKCDREDVPLGEIPFVKEHWKDHPRPPLPKSLLWTEEEATLIVQSHWRGYKVRIESEIQELRQWQKEWREENEDVKGKVEDFWEKQMPEGDQVTVTVSEEHQNTNDENSEKPQTPKSAPQQEETREGARSSTKGSPREAEQEAV